MASVEAVDRRKPKKRKRVRVGDGFASEAELRAKLRGNTGSMEPLIRDGDGLKLPFRYDDNGKLKPFLPSETWIDTYFTEIDDRDADGKPVIVKWFDKGTVSPASSERRTLAPHMKPCRKCGRLTPPQAIEVPWTRQTRENTAMELLCTLPLAMAASVAILADDSGLGFNRTLQVLERLRRSFGLSLFRDADGGDWVMVPERKKAEVVVATEAYWDAMQRGYAKSVRLPTVCADCRSPGDHRFYGKSSSAAVMRKIADTHAEPRPDQMELKPERKSELRKEIKRVMRYRWIPRD